MTTKKKTAATTSERIAMTIKNSKKHASRIKKIKETTLKKLTSLKDKSQFKVAFEDYRGKLAKTTTVKTREKYEKKLVSLCEDLVNRFEELKKIIENQVQILEDYKSENDLLLENVSMEKKAIAQLRRNADKGVFIYGEIDIGEKLPPGSIFRSRYES